MQQPAVPLKDNTEDLYLAVEMYGILHISDSACLTSAAMHAGLAEASLSAKQTFSGHADSQTCQGSGLSRL